MKITFALALILICSISMASDAPTASELLKKYPSLGMKSKRPENKSIICPYLRLIERSGFLDSFKMDREPEIILSVRHLLKGTQEFGLRYLAAKVVATAVSAGQNISGSADLSEINLTALHTAKGIAHECGITFKYLGTEVDDETRKTTLAKLQNLAQNGRISLEDLMTVKKERCQEQNVKMTLAGKVEMELIFNYLGGKDNGYILYEDLERFLFTIMPTTKATDYI